MKRLFRLGVLAAICGVAVFSCKKDDVSVTGVTLTRNNADVSQGATLHLAVGVTLTLIPKVEPENAKNKQVSWSSSAPAVASVTDGIVSGLTEGTAIITVTTEDGNKTASCIINVTTNIVPVTSVTLSHDNRTLAHNETLPLAVDKTLSLVPIVAPENATNANVSWNSSNTNVATVDNGVVTGKTAGSTTISVTTQDGNKTAQCVVNVTGSGGGNTSQYDIYVCGQNKDGYATYWKNGVAHVNQNIKGAYKAIAVENGEVYTLYSIGDYSGFHPVFNSGYCKNNGTSMAFNVTDFLSSITVSNGNVYVAGDVYNGSDTRAAYWLNGTAVNLHPSDRTLSNANSIFVSDGNVYVAGSDRYSILPTIQSAVYWKNGTKVTLAAGSYGIGADANSIFVTDNDVYVAGRSENYYITYWKNGIPTKLHNEQFVCGTRSFFVSPNGDVHVTGSHWRNPINYFKYWKNGVETVLGSSSGSNSVPLRLAVVDADVYIVGNDLFGASKYWKNGTVVDFTSESGSFAWDIVAVPVGK